MEKLLNAENIRTLRRMIIIGVSTLLIAVIANQFLTEGIRLPILLLSLTFGKGGVEEISAKDAAPMAESAGALFLDIRTAEDYDYSHIAKAASTPFMDIVKDASLLADKDRNQPVIVYEGKDTKNKLVFGKYLLKKGFTKVYILKEGIENWEEQGLPLDY